MTIVEYKEISGLIDFLLIFLQGFYFDLWGFLPFASFLCIYLLISPGDKNIFWKILNRFILSVFIGTFIFTHCAEWFFWDEFTSRFNFIAVDYLIYTTELLGTIKESYPMHWLYLGIVLITSLILFLNEKILKPTYEKRRKILYLLLIPIWVLSWDLSRHVPSIELSNVTSIELSKNGVFELFAAFRNNKLNYTQFYATEEEKDINTILQSRLNDGAVEISKRGVLSRHLQPKDEKLPMNVFVIAVESLSAEFLEHFGNTEKITPNLDKLAEESLFFTNIYATGTRSVRGLEALTLSLPPTPGYSVVKRPDNAHLFSLGSMFKKFNYDLKFIYGGYGYFDNMNTYFHNNYFEIVDRTSFSKKDISFANIWGIADEDVLLRMVKEADKAYLENKRFCYFTLTISNHRPYSYTKGRIDIPSGTSRAGAVKYTDYAIGKFIEVAKTRPWFSDTLFVIVADHSAKGRGKISIPVASYHIPLLIYAPKIISPQMIDKVASQIDVIPTIADIMKINYQSKFLGRSILTMTKEDERFFSGTYQSLGYYRHGSFVELGPKKSIKVYRYDPIKRELNTELIKDDVVAKEAIAFYQYAGFLLDHDLYGEQQ